MMNYKKDGVEDLIVGAPNADGKGCVYIFNGKETGNYELTHL